MRFPCFRCRYEKKTEQVECEIFLFLPHIANYTQSELILMQSRCNIQNVQWMILVFNNFQSVETEETRGYSNYSELNRQVLREKKKKKKLELIIINEIKINNKFTIILICYCNYSYFFLVKVCPFIILICFWSQLVHFLYFK